MNAQRRELLRRVSLVRKGYEMLLCATIPHRPHVDARYKRLERDLSQALARVFSRVTRAYGSVPALVGAHRRVPVRKAASDEEPSAFDTEIDDPTQGNARDDLLAATTLLLIRRVTEALPETTIDMIIGATLADVAVEAGQESLTQLSLGEGFQWADPRAEFDALFPELKAEVMAFIQSAIKDNASRVASLIVNGAQSGLSVADVIKQIEQEVEDLTRAQVERIARTEMTRVWGAVSQAAMENNGVTARRWLTMKDQNVCTLCIENASAGWVPIDEPFPSDDDAPPGHPNCRCQIIPLMIRWNAPDNPWTGDEEEGLVASVMKAGFNPDEARDEKGEWTTAGGITFSGKAEIDRTDEFEKPQFREFTDQQLARLSGAPDHATVTVDETENALYFEASGPNGLTMERELRIEDDGTLSLHNHTFLVDQTEATKGMGVRSIAMQATQASAIGVERIECYADRSEADGDTPATNGYYTWPRLGFDAPLPKWAIQGFGKKSYSRLWQLMSTQKGRDWWKENGRGLFVTLNLRGLGYQHFREYAKEKGVHIGS